MHPIEDRQNIPSSSRSWSCLIRQFLALKYNLHNPDKLKNNIDEWFTNSNQLISSVPPVKIEDGGNGVLVN